MHNLHSYYRLQYSSLNSEDVKVQGFPDENDCQNPQGPRKQTHTALNTRELQFYFPIFILALYEVMLHKYR